MKFTIECVTGTHEETEEVEAWLRENEDGELEQLDEPILVPVTTVVPGCGWSGERTTTGKRKRDWKKDKDHPKPGDGTTMTHGEEATHSDNPCPSCGGADLRATPKD